MKPLHALVLVLLAAAVCGFWALTSGAQPRAKGAATSAATSAAAPSAGGMATTPGPGDGGGGLASAGSSPPQQERADATSEAHAGEEEPAASWTLVIEAREATSGEEVSLAATLSRPRTPREGAGIERVRTTLPLGAEGLARWSPELGDWTRIQVQAWAPGFVSHDEVFFPEQGETETIVLEPGASVRGRVLSLKGEPVEGAEVRLARPGEGARRLRMETLARTRTDGEGRFLVGVGGNVSCLLEATHDEFGRIQRELDLVHQEVNDLGDLVLEGAGLIEGTLVTADQEPAVDVGLTATLDGERVRGGLLRARVRTDEDGRFRFANLAQGEFRLSHGLGSLLPSFGDAGRVRTGSEEVHLTLAALPVAVRAEVDGQPASFRSLSIFVGAEQEWVETTEFAPVNLETRLLPLDVPLRLEAESTGAQVDADGGGGSPEERLLVAEVLLVAGAPPGEAVLRPVSSADAALQVVVTGPDGAQLEEYQVRLWSERGTLEVLEAPDDLVDGAFRGLEPGTYRFRPALVQWPPWEASFYPARHPAEVQLSSGQVTEVQVVAMEGGHVELDLSGAPPELAGRNGWLFVFQGADPDGTGAAGRSIDTYHRSEQGLGVTHSRLEFGLVWSSVQALEPGTWTLQLGVDGYRTWRQTVDVLARETTRVVVEMVPE